MHTCAQYTAHVAQLQQERLRRWLIIPPLTERMCTPPPHIASWERMSLIPSLANYLWWTRSLGRRLAIVDTEGAELVGEETAGDFWEEREISRLIVTLRRRRQETARTQVDVARGMGLTQPFMNELEREKRHPGVMRLYTWALELGCTVELVPGTFNNNDI